MSPLLFGSPNSFPFLNSRFQIRATQTPIGNTLQPLKNGLTLILSDWRAEFSSEMELVTSWYYYAGPISTNLFCSMREWEDPSHNGPIMALTRRPPSRLYRHPRSRELTAKEADTSRRVPSNLQLTFLCSRLYRLAMLMDKTAQSRVRQGSMSRTLSRQARVL